MSYPKVPAQCYLATGKGTYTAKIKCQIEKPKG